MELDIIFETIYEMSYDIVLTSTLLESFFVNFMFIKNRTEIQGVLKEENL